MGFQYRSWLLRNRGPFTSVLIIGILTRLVQKTTTPHPSSTRLLIIALGSIIFSFMDGFSGYNQIDILPADQHKTTFICPWGTFSYQKLPFGLKNVGATFQRAMSYAPSTISNILWNHTSMTYPPTHPVDPTISVIYGLFFFDVGSTASI
jgi:hypothetical protein